MSDFRIKYGQAIGPIWNSNLTTLQPYAPVIPSGTTRPNVTIATLLYTNNTSNTTITDFQLDTVTRGGEDYEGKEVTLFFLDDSTTLANAGNFVLSSSAGNLFPANSLIKLLYHNSSWYETNRSANAPAKNVLTVLIGGTAASVNVDGVTTLLFKSTDAVATIRSFSGGFVGQILSIGNTSTGTVSMMAFNVAGNISMAGSNSLAIDQSGSYTALKVSPTQWAFQRPVA